MIWCMNPVRMPHAFCIAQTTIINLAAYVLTGLCTAFTIATSFYVYNPKPSFYVSSSYVSLASLKSVSARHPSLTADTLLCRLLRWKPVYLIFIFAFPVAAFVAHLTVIIKFDAVKPTDDDMGCDATDPMWCVSPRYSFW